MATITFNGNIQFMSNSYRDAGCHYIFVTFRKPSGDFYLVSNSWILGWRVQLQGNYGPSSSGSISIDDANPFIVPINFTTTIPDCVLASCDNRLVFYVIPCCRVNDNFNPTLGSPQNVGNLTINAITSALTNIPAIAWDGFAIYELPLENKQYYFCNEEIFGLRTYWDVASFFNSIQNTNYFRCNSNSGPSSVVPYLPAPTGGLLPSLVRLKLCTRSSMINNGNANLVISSEYNKTNCCFACSNYTVNRNVDIGDIVHVFYQGCGPSNFGQIIYSATTITTPGTFNQSFCAIDGSFLALHLDSGLSVWTLITPTLSQCQSNDLYYSNANCP